MEMSESRKEGTNRSRELIGVVFACIGAACWGFSGTCVSYLVGHNQVDIPWLACVRLFVAGLLFLIVACICDRDKFAVLFHDRGLIMHTIAYTLVAVVLMQISYMSGIKYTNAGTTLLLLEVSIPIVLVVECVRSRRLPRLIEIVALVLALGGVTSIATQGNLGSIGINPLGLMWGLLSAVANAGYILLSGKVVERCGSNDVRLRNILAGHRILRHRESKLGRRGRTHIGCCHLGSLVGDGFLGLGFLGRRAHYCHDDHRCVEEMISIFIKNQVDSHVWQSTWF